MYGHTISTILSGHDVIMIAEEGNIADLIKYKSPCLTREGTKPIQS
jgi:hypothetical protein